LGAQHFVFAPSQLAERLMACVGISLQRSLTILRNEKRHDSSTEIVASVSTLAEG
jgi:hypothetical protein